MILEIDILTGKTIARTAGHFLFVTGLLVALNGCATSAKPEAMTVITKASERPFPQMLQHDMCVRKVAGGEKTNPLWASKVDNDGFRTALSASLNKAGLMAPAHGCGYPIDTDLLGLSQPAFGFDMTVTSHVNYKVYNPAGQPFLLETIDTPYTATVSDAFAGVKRLRLANEGSIRTNIHTFFDKLRNAKPLQDSDAAAPVKASPDTKTAPLTQ